MEVEPFAPCLFCGGNRLERRHLARCDGQQGGRDDEPAFDPAGAFGAPPPAPVEASEGQPVDPLDAPPAAGDEPAAAPAEQIPRHRRTSAASFYNAVNEGRIKTIQHHVWSRLYATGPATMMEIHRYCRDQRIIGETHSISPRFAELRDLGFIREVGARPCRFTGQISILWEAIPLELYTPPEVGRRRCETCGELIRRTVTRRPREE